MKKFLIHRANSQDGFITVSTLNSYGIHLLKVLQKKAQWEPKGSIKDFHEQLEFKLSEFFYIREGFYLSKQNIIFFNQIIKSEFDDHLYDMVTMNIAREYKTTIEREIQIGLNFYGILETDRSMESMIKAYQRWRNERNYMVIKP
ncbi:MAG: hypothetical protein HQ522_17700 [Bacteroidetes bacterium]|nr:hypothetical protein [Bacteroidota bacterium]